VERKKENRRKGGEKEEGKARREKEIEIQSFAGI